MADVPPLEEVPEFMKKIQQQANEVIKENQRRMLEEQAKKKEDALLKKNASTYTFGGMKKGFLCGGGGTAKTVKTVKADTKSSADVKVDTKSSDDVKVDTKSSDDGSKETTEEIPFIRAQPAKSDLVIKEVQDKLVDANLAQDFQDKLAKRLEGHTDVMDVLSDPEWLPILAEFQKDPEGAMIKYNKNSKVKKTLTELCNVLGDTFLHMDKSKKTEEELLSGKLMDDPVVKEAITDPLVIQIMEYMKQGANDKVQRCIQTANPDQKKHIQALIDCGLFSFTM